MSTDHIRSREESEASLHQACERWFGYLSELCELHPAFDPPTGRIAETEHVLRLRKTYFHVRAITRWALDTTYVMHVVLPEIRVARDQLEPILREHLYDGGSLTGWHDHIPREKTELDAFVHPTPTRLMAPGDVGGFGEADAVLYLARLYMLLIGLAVDYGFALAAVAKVLGRPKQSEICDVFSRVTGERNLSPLGEALRFARPRG